MKTKRKNRMIVSAGLVAVVAFTMLLAAPLVAQSSYELKANVPFRFQAGEVQGSAAIYTFENVSPGLLVMRNARGAGEPLGLPIRIADAQDRPFQPRLVFHRYGNRYFLREIWSMRIGQKLLPSREERELMRSLRPFN